MSASDLAGEHQSWCRADVHGECCSGECGCGRDERVAAIAAALTAEREKALAPLLALAVELDHLGDVDGWGIAADIRRIVEEARQ